MRVRRHAPVISAVRASFMTKLKQSKKLQTEINTKIEKEQTNVDGLLEKFGTVSCFNFS